MCNQKHSTTKHIYENIQTNLHKWLSNIWRRDDRSEHLLLCVFSDIIITITLLYEQIANITARNKCAKLLGMYEMNRQHYLNLQ